MQKKFILVSHGPLHINPRELRQLEVLKERGSVTAIGLTDPCLDGVEFVRIVKKPFNGLVQKAQQASLLLSRRYEQYLAECYTLEKPVHFSEPTLVCAHNIQAMPLSKKIAGNRPILLDLHEYHPKEFESSVIWKIFIQKNVINMCRKWLAQASYRYTVGKAIADAYTENFSVNCDVIRSAAPFQEIQPSPVSDEQIHLVHHGAANKDRKLENLIKMMEFTDSRYILNLTLIGDKNYIEHLRNLSAGKHNICWHDPVSVSEVSQTINKYDIGIVLYPQGDFNIDNCLPNKFFEFIQGRLVLAVGSSPEMASIVRSHNLGIVSDSAKPEHMASALNSLTSEYITQVKNNVALAAKELCANREKEKLSLIIDKLIGE